MSNCMPNLRGMLKPGVCRGISLATSLLGCSTSASARTPLGISGLKWPCCADITPYVLLIQTVAHFWQLLECQDIWMAADHTVLDELKLAKCKYITQADYNRLFSPILSGSSLKESQMLESWRHRGISFVHFHHTEELRTHTLALHRSSEPQTSLFSTPQDGFLSSPYHDTHYRYTWESQQRDFYFFVSR